MWLPWQANKAYVFGTYEPEITRVLQQVVREAWLALDIGAHIGYYTLLFSRLVGPQGRVVAFEPSSENFQMLKANIELNACSNVVLEKKAVADGSGRRVLARNDAAPLSSTGSLVWGSGGEEVETISLDEYFRGGLQRVAFVKVDVEGAEL